MCVTSIECLRNVRSWVQRDQTLRLRPGGAVHLVPCCYNMPETQRPRDPERERTQKWTSENVTGPGPERGIMFHPDVPDFLPATLRTATANITTELHSIYHPGNKKCPFSAIERARLVIDDRCTASWDAPLGRRSQVAGHRSQVTKRTDITPLTLRLLTVPSWPSHSALIRALIAQRR